mgnify:CR=1 FL=1
MGRNGALYFQPPNGDCFVRFQYQAMAAQFLKRQTCGHVRLLWRPRNKWIRVSNGEIHTFGMRIFRIRFLPSWRFDPPVEMVKFPVFIAVKLQFQWSNPHLLDVKSTLLMIQSLILVQSIVPMVKSVFGRSIHILPSTAAFPPRLDGALQPRRP